MNGLLCRSGMPCLFKINCKPRAEADVSGYAEAQRDCRRSIKYKIQ